MGAEAGAEFADNAGSIFHQETDVETSDDFSVGDNAEGMGVGAAKERIEGLRICGVGGDGQKVGDDGAGSGPFSSTGAVEHDLTEGIAFDENCVVDAVNAGKGMVCGN